MSVRYQTPFWPYIFRPLDHVAVPIAVSCYYYNKLGILELCLGVYNKKVVVNIRKFLRLNGRQPRSTRLIYLNLFHVLSTSFQ